MAVVLWLALAYPLSSGPAFYAWARGWLSHETYRSAYAPLRLYLPGPAFEFWARYVEWWEELAYRDSYRDSLSPPPWDRLRLPRL